MRSKRSHKIRWIRHIFCRTDRNLCSRCVFMKIKENDWIFYLINSIISFNLCFYCTPCKTIWRKKTPKSQTKMHIAYREGVDKGHSLLMPKNFTNKPGIYIMVVQSWMKKKNSLAISDVLPLCSIDTMSQRMTHAECISKCPHCLRGCTPCKAWYTLCWQCLPMQTNLLPIIIVLQPCRVRKIS